MDDVIKGVLEIGTNGKGEVVINHPQLEVDEFGVGHIVFSPRQARHFGRLILKHADKAYQEEKEAKGRYSVEG